MALKIYTGPSGGDWNVGSNWSPPGVPDVGDDVSISSVGAILAVNLTSSETVSSLVITGDNSSTPYNVALTLSPSSSLTTSGAITLTNAESTISGTGTINAGGGITGGGSIIASGGPLEISGVVTGIGTLAIGDSSGVPTDTAASTKLILDSAGNSSAWVTFLGINANLEIASGASLTVANTMAIGTNVVKLLGSGVQLTDANGITIATDGFLEGSGTVSTSTNVTGAGLVSIDFYDGTGGTITASGGTLQLSGNVAGRTLAIASGSPSDLKILGRTTAASFTIDNANQTLEIGDNGQLTLTGGPQTVSNGKIQLDFGTGTLTAAGIVLGNGTADGTIVGAGKIVSSITHGGTGTGSSITAFGFNDMLEITGAVTGIDTLTVGNTATLKLDSASSATSLTFGGTTGTLEIGGGAGLTLATAMSVGANTIQLDGAGAELNDAGGITLAAGGFIIGSGVVDANTAVGGSGGTIIASGGLLEFKGSVDASNLTFQIDNTAGSDLKFDSTVSGTAPTIMFDGTNSGQGILDLTNEGHLAGFNGQVANFATGDQILVSGVSGDTVQLIGTNQLGIYNSSHVLQETINLAGDYTGAGFALNYSNGTDTITTTAICFYPGTLIRTPHGEVAVETLKRGDLVLTSDGVAKPVQWLGRQTISTVFADPLRVWPVRIKAGALGENVPARDLRLSPDHAVLVDGALIQAGALVNGTSIIRETAVPKVFVYYHVELDDHSLVLAENTPAETFIDNVDRLAFDNWDEHEALYPNGKQITELPYPRAKAHRQVPVEMRVRLAERAQAIDAATDGVAA